METFEPNINPSNSDTSRESNHKKHRKIGDNTSDQNSLNLMPWRSDTEQQIYSRKLVDALSRIPSPAGVKPRPAGQIRLTADRVLAATAKGRTRWSRAILRRSMKLKRNHKKAKKLPATGLKRTEIGRERNRIRRLPAVQKKARVLGRLVPGCRKVAFPNLLEEATDYISALEMQVRAMTALAELLSGGAPAGLSGLS